MNNLLYFLIAAAVSHEMLLAGNCPDGSSGTTIFFVNGINTDEVEAARSLAILEFEVRGKIAGTVKAGTCLKFKGSYNETANMLADLYEALKQTVAAGQAAPALSQILLGRLPLPDSLANRLAAYTPIRLDQLVTEPAQSEVDQFAREYRDELNAGNSVIVVGYSQGNLFANSARRKLQQISVPDLSGFKLIAVATPAHLVEGGGPWVTLCGDMIKLVPGSLPFNFGGFIGCEKLRVPYGWFIHKFVESYLTDTQTLSAIRDLIYAAIPGPNQRPTAGFLMTSSSASGLNGQALNLTVSPGRAQVVNLNAQAPYSFDPDGDRKSVV